MELLKAERRSRNAAPKTRSSKAAPEQQLKAEDFDEARVDSEAGGSGSGVIVISDDN